MSVQAPKQYPGLIWQETFNSEQSVRANGGVPTNDNEGKFRNGVYSVTVADDNYINLPNRINTSFRNGFSARAIVRVIDNPTDFKRFLSLVDLEGYNFQLSNVYLDPNYFNASLGNLVPTYVTKKTTTGINNNIDFYDIVFTFNGSVATLYINGIKNSQSGVALARTTNNRIGTQLSTVTLNSDWNLLEVYNRALSAEEIHNLHYGLQNVAPNLNYNPLHGTTPTGNTSVFNGSSYLESPIIPNGDIIETEFWFKGDARNTGVQGIIGRGTGTSSGIDFTLWSVSSVFRVYVEAITSKTFGSTVDPTWNFYYIKLDKINETLTVIKNNTKIYNNSPATGINGIETNAKVVFGAISSTSSAIYGEIANFKFKIDNITYIDAPLWSDKLNKNTSYPLTEYGSITFKDNNIKTLLDYTSLNGVVENRVKYNPVGLGYSPIVAKFNANGYLHYAYPLSTLMADANLISVKGRVRVNDTSRYNLFALGNTVTGGQYGLGSWIDNNTIRLELMTPTLGRTMLDIGVSVGTDWFDYEVQFDREARIVRLFVNNGLINGMSLGEDIGTLVFNQNATFVGARRTTDYLLNGEYSTFSLEYDGIELINVNYGESLNNLIDGQVPTNLNIIQEDLTATPTPTDITFKKLGSQHSAFFNGLTSGININYDIDATGDRTLMGWFNIHGLGGSGKGVICLIERIQFRLYGNTTTLVFYSTSVDFIYTPFELDYFTDYFFFIQRAADGETSMYLGTKDSPPTLAVSGNTGIPEGGSNNLIGTNVTGTRIFHGLIPKVVLIDGILPLEQGIQAWSNTLKMIQ